MNRQLLIIAFILLTGCQPTPETESPSDNNPEDTSQEEETSPSEDTTSADEGRPEDVTQSDLMPAPDPWISVYFEGHTKDLTNNAGQTFEAWVGVGPYGEVNMSILEMVSEELDIINLRTGERVPFSMELIPPVDWEPPEITDVRDDNYQYEPKPDNTDYGIIRATASEELSPDWHVFVLLQPPHPDIVVKDPSKLAPSILEHGIAGIRVHPGSAPELKTLAVSPRQTMDGDIFGIRAAVAVSEDIVWDLETIEALTPTNLTTNEPCPPAEPWRDGEEVRSYIIFFCGIEANTTNRVTVPDVSQAQSFARTFVTEPIPEQVELDLSLDMNEIDSFGLKL